MMVYWAWRIESVWLRLFVADAEIRRIGMTRGTRRLRESGRCTSIGNELEQAASFGHDIELARSIFTKARHKTARRTE